jgi:hypothetical protein
MIWINTGRLDFSAAFSAEKFLRQFVTTGQG